MNDVERAATLTKEIGNAAQVAPLSWWIKNLPAEIAKALAAVRAEEREACAKIADSAADEWHRFASLSGMASEIAAAIRGQAAKDKVA